MNRRYLFIVNPAAGSRGDASVSSALRQVLSRTNVSYELRETTVPKEATRLAKEGAEECTHVVSVGGDGTAHEVVNGIMGTTAGFGLVPTGSGNDFSRALGIPPDMNDAIKLLQHGTERSVDVGRLNDRYFVNGVGIGLDGAAGHRFRKRTPLFGGYGYAVAAFEEALRYPGFQVKVRLPEKRFRGRALMLSVSNGPVQGGGFQLAPDASVEDGLFDVQLVRYVSPIRRIVNGVRWARGTQEQLQDVEINQVRRLSVHTYTPVPAHVDGEPIFIEEGTHQLEVLERSLNVICS